MANVYQCMLIWLFLPLVKPGSESSLTRNGVPEYTSLCPYSACNSTHKEILLEEGVTPCCQSCSCSHDCYKAANCCPGTTPLTKSGEPEYPCVDMAELLNEERLLYFRSHSIKYRVVNKCPDENRAKAFPACQHPVTLQDYVPVSDNMYEVVYRNQHCALCHSVHEYVYWSLSTECRNLEKVSFETFEERDQYILTNCTIMAYHPEPKMADMSRCYSDSEMTSSCNVSEKWNYYDRGLENACHNKYTEYNTAYTFLVNDVSKWTFSNVYCLLCNQPKNFRLPNSCPVPDVDNSKGTSLIFSALIHLWSDDTTKEDKLCRSTEIWDPFDIVCRHLVCPTDMIPVYGHCRSSFTYAEGYQIGLVFEATLTTPGKIETLQIISPPLMNKITDTLGPNFRCGHCQLEFFRYMNETNIYIDVSFYTTKYCSSKYLTTKLEKLVHRQILSFTLDTIHGPSRITLKSTLRKIPNEKRSKSYLSRMAGARGCFAKVQLTEYNIQNCPFVELPEYKWNLINFSQNRLEGLLENTTMIDHKKETALVCVETYFLLQELKRQGRNGATKSGMIAVCGILLHTLLAILIFYT